MHVCICLACTLTVLPKRFLMLVHVCVCESFRFLTPTVYCCTARACGNIWFGSTNWTTTAHTHIHTHIGPGPCVEARDAARPGRARRGGCGQLLRRAAETPEHLAQVVVPGRKSDWSSAEIRPGRLLSLSEKSVPAPWGSRSQAARPRTPPPAPVKTHPSKRSGDLACLSGSGGSKSKFKS